MKQKVGNVIMDYTYYNGEDAYSDGDVEERLLEIVSNDLDYNKSINDSDDFAILYHLAKDRQGIVQIMNISSNEDVLEIGAGCGAITERLSEEANFVECVELSKRRSLINANRNKDKNNIVIDVGNFEDIVINKKYDVITLIGVLEYAVYYLKSKSPYDDMLNKVKEYLKDDGRLYIAIENRLGLKYFSGASEDHVGVEYEGILNYPTTDKVRTFSKSELEGLLKRNGFNNIYFYYPYPDYKFPKVIYSDDYLGSYDEMSLRYSNYGGARISNFDEARVFQSLVGTEEWKIVANSFIVEAKVR